MLKKHEQLRIYDLLKAGHSVKDIGAMTRISLPTVYKYRRLAGELQDGGYERKTTDPSPELVPFQELVDKHIKQRKLKANATYVILQQQGYKGSYSAFMNYYKLRKQQLRPLNELQHIETEPGEQAQVDWAHFGEMTINGKREKVYLFAYILSWSRALYMEFVVRQNQRTLQACHIHAFEKLGIPKTVVYDNMKTVVNRREKLPDGTTRVVYNLKFLDFARYYRFEAKACHPYWPQEKGKVEASFRYARNRFVRCTPSMNLTLDGLNAQLREWLDEEAQQRNHRTTGVKPHDRWLEERASLTFPADLAPYYAPSVRDHHTTQYGIMSHKGITYHLGQRYARAKIMVREVQDHGFPSLELYHDNKLISVVPIPTKRHSWVTVFDEPSEAEQSSGQEKNETKPDSTKAQDKSYGIVVAQRDPDYYSLHTPTIIGGAYE